MKLKIFNTFILMFTLALGMNTYGQTDSIPPKENMQFIEPEVIDADLNFIVPPVGFEKTDLFNGYIHFQTSSAIILTLIKDVTYLNVAKGMNEEFYKANNLTLINESKITSDYGVKGVVYKFSFVLEGMDFVRYTVYAGDLSQTLWLAVTYPEKNEELLEEEILKSFQSINLNPRK